MNDICPTVHVEDERAPGGFRRINADKFDPKIHELFDETKKKVKPIKEVEVEEVETDVDPLAELDDDWREAKGRGVAKIKRIAEAVSGRTPENMIEAEAMIDEELAKRAAESDEVEVVEVEAPAAPELVVPLPPPPAAVE